VIKKIFTHLLVWAYLLVSLGACTNVSTINISLNGIKTDKDLSECNVVPFYLPQKTKDKDLISSITFSKSGQEAKILYDNEEIVYLNYFGLLDYNGNYKFPEVGKATIIEENYNITVVCTLSKSYGCIISSSQVPRDELVKVADSFELRDEP
jgi:hypothetical protein